MTEGNKQSFVLAEPLMNMKRNTFITEQKCLAVVWDIEKFKQYLGVKPFKIITNYMTLETI